MAEKGLVPAQEFSSTGLAFEDLAAQAESSYDVLDTFPTLKDLGVEKEDLIGKKFVIEAWKTTTDPKTMREYVTMLLVFPDGTRAVMNDGSTGIAEQVRQISQTRYNGSWRPVLFAKGLRKSEYGVDANNVPLPKDSTETPASMATTYYL